MNELKRLQKEEKMKIVEINQSCEEEEEMGIEMK
jgi:hypothetical protein